MVLFPYADMTSNKSPIAFIFISAYHLVMRPKLRKLFGNFFFTRINGKRYLFHANYPVKWTEGIGSSREFHFFSIKNGNAFSPELLQRINDYKMRNRVSIMTQTLAAVSSDIRVSFANALRMGNNKKVADALERMKKAKEQLTEDDFEQLCKECKIPISDFVNDMPELETKQKEKVLQTLSREGLTHVFEPIDMSILNDLDRYKSFDPSWIPTLLNATNQTELEHKKLEARASKGFNKLLMMGIFGGIIVMMITVFIATSDISLSLPEFGI